MLFAWRQCWKSITSKFKVDVSFFLLIFLFFFSPKQTLLGKLFLALCLHELGHWVVIVVFRMKIESFRLYVGGFLIRKEDSFQTFSKDIFLYAAGILVNFFCVCLSRDVEFRQVSLGLMFLNLLPIYPLDGYQLLKCILEYFFPVYYSFYFLWGISLLTLLIGTIFFVLFRLDWVYLFYIFYFLFLELRLFSQRFVAYQRFLWKKSEQKNLQPIKKIRFHFHFKRFFYRYHSIVMSDFGKEISERELLNEIFLAKEI